MKKDSNHSSSDRDDDEPVSSPPADATQSLAASDVFRSKPDADVTGTAEAQSEIVDHPIPGRRFGPYRIERMLGSGGMGEVYEAEHEAGHRVALKVLSREAFFSKEHRERFLREGRVAASISHPRSLYVYGTEEVGGRPVISMELAPGGTLRDRIEAEGPLAPEAAVSAILQVIDGLEAVHSAGIVHRDVKPVNCFIDWDGGVKIGDFGLSLPSGELTETQLTAAGTFLGTPAYASPEQVRGTKLDARSDIYSVGGTLYYLLTGKAPFEGRIGFSLLAAILEDRPASPESIRPGIPQGLAAVALRCLAKQPGDRYQTYAELRRALLPFVASERRPARWTTRLSAGIIDWFVASGLADIPHLLHSGSGVVDDVRQRRLVSSPLENLAGYLLIVLLFGIVEGRWGLTPGKALRRLRVVGEKGRAPGIVRGVARAAVFWFLPALISIASARSTSVNREVTIGEVIGDLAIALLFLTARSTNGWSGIHDLLFRIRVVKGAPPVRRAALAPHLVADRDLSEGEKVGPYILAGSAGRPAPGRVVEAFDPHIRRKVWIWFRPSGTPPILESRRRLSRPGRARWLHARRTAAETWDAFEAVAGLPLSEAAATGAPWSRVRLWLSDLQEECAAAGADDVALAPDRVWIADGDRAILLDFPAPGDTAPTESAEPAAPAFGEGLAAQVDVAETQSFLHEVATAALAGFGDELRKGEKPWRVLPLHATEFLNRLERRAFKALTELRNELHDLSAMQPGIRRSRRATQFAMLTIPLLLLAAGAILADRGKPEAYLLQQSLERLRTVENLRSGEDENAGWARQLGRSLSALIARGVKPQTDPAYGVEKKTEARALEVYIAGRLAAAAPDSFNTGMHDPLRAANRQRLRKILGTGLTPTAAEIDAAEKEIRPFLDKTREGAARPLSPAGFALDAVMFSTIILALIMFLNLLVGCIAPQRLFARAGPFAVVSGEGRPAPRRRILVRNLVAFAPFLPASVSALFLPYVAASGYLIVSFVLFAGGVIWAIASPSRGIHDWIAGTWLVPR